MIWYDIDQNSEEWLDLRRGKFTASTFADLMAKKDTATYEKAVYQVAYEIMTGESPEFFETDYMRRGHDVEELAKREYEMLRFVDVLPGGFFAYDDYTGASPDGLIGTDGLIEVKSPAFNTMINYLKKQVVPNQYKWQVQGQLFVTGREWCDFMAYHPKLPVLIKRVYPDKDMFDTLRNELDIAIQSVKDIISQIQKHR